MSDEKVRLIFGYKGSEETPQRDVEIGRRITGADLMRIGDDPESSVSAQFNLMLLSAAVTKFGTLPVPVPLTVLLSLNSVDREDLHRAHAKFIREARGGKRAERLADARLRLADGFRIGGETFDVVEFGRLLTGYDEIEAEGLSHWRQACFLLGKQITSLSQSAGAATHPGSLAVEAFESLHDEDLYELMNFSADWRDSFRRNKRAELQPDGGGGGDVPADPLSRDDRARGADAQS